MDRQAYMDFKNRQRKDRHKVCFEEYEEAGRRKETGEIRKLGNLEIEEIEKAGIVE
jgi:hypothetical protein